MKEENWIWMPHPGHFICAENCKFWLNTYVGKYIVSTIGEHYPDSQVRRILAESRKPDWYEKNKHLKGYEFDYAYRKEFGFEEIGADRLYETMVFKAGKSNNKCCPYQQISGENIDFAGYNSAGEAMKGHYKLCQKWAIN